VRVRKNERERKREREREYAREQVRRMYTLIRNGYYCIICNVTHRVSIHIRITKYNAKLAKMRGALYLIVA